MVSKSLIGLFVVIIIFSASLISASTQQDLWGNSTNIWRFDNNLNDSRGTDDGVNNGAVADSTGIINQSYNFTNRGHVLVEGYNKNVTAFSIWFKPASLVTTSTNHHSLLGFGDGFSDLCLGSCTAGLTNEIVTLEFVGGSQPRVGWCQAGQTINATSWHNVVGSFDGNTYELYVDGVKRDNCNSGGDLDEFFAVNLTFANRQDLFTSFFYNGSIDETVIFNESLNQSDVDWLYNNGQGNELVEPAPPPGPPPEIDKNAVTQFGYNNLNQPTLSRVVINYSQQNVNDSLFWDGHLYGDEGHWGINGTEIFYNTDNVGIGTGDPSNVLEVHGTTNQGLRLSGGAEAGWNFYTWSADGSLYLNQEGVGDKFKFEKTSGDFSVLVGGADIAGDVGIGTVSPNSKLEVNGSTLIEGDLNITKNDGGFSGLLQSWYGHPLGTPRLAVGVASGSFMSLGTTSAVDLHMFTGDTSGTNSDDWVLTLEADQNVTVHNNLNVSGEGTINEIDIFNGGGTDNTIIGKSAGLDNSAGDNNNVFLGFQAGSEMTSDNSVFVGYQSGFGKNGVSTGTRNVGVGYRSLFSIESGDDNTAIGTWAGNSLTTGVNNMLFGYQSGFDLVSGSSNTLIGYQAGAEQTGSDNVAIGNDALEGQDGISTAIRNTVIGRQSGTILTTGTDNLFLGYQSGSTVTNVSNKLMIDITGRNDTLIYGDFLERYVTINGDLNVTNGSLSVDGSVTANSFNGSSSGLTGLDLNEALIGYWNFNTGPRDYSGLSNDGTVESAIHNGTDGFNGAGDYMFDGNDDHIDITSNLPEISQVEKVTISMWVKHNNVNTVQVIFISGTTSTEWIQIATLADGSLIMDTEGSTGRGTFDGYGAQVGTDTWHQVVLVYDGSLSGNANRLKGFVDGEQFTFDSFDGTVGATTGDSGSEVARIGFTSVSMDGSIDDVRMYNRSLTASEVLRLYNLRPSDSSTIFDESVGIAKDLIVNNSDLFVDTSTGRIGMGTDNPQQELHINSSGANTRIRIENSGVFNGGLEMRNSTGGNVGGFVGTQTSTDFSSPAGLNGVIQMKANNNIQFHFGSDGTRVGLMRGDNGRWIFGSGSSTSHQVNVEGGINATDDSWFGGDLEVVGNVGLGTSNATEKLEVNGNITMRSQGTNLDTMLRFSEGTSAGDLIGAYAHYDGFNNFFVIGTHNVNDALTANDIPVIRIGRPGTLIELLKNTVVTGDLNVTENLNAAQNVSIGDTLNVTDNVVIGDRLFVGVTPEETSGVLNPGDATFAGTVTFQNIGIFPANSSSAFFAFNAGDDSPEKIAFYFNFSGTLNTTTGLFCDSVNTPFVSDDVANLLAVLFTAELGTTQLPFIIDVFHNSTCATVNLANLGARNTPDLTSISYAISPPGILNIIDGGIVNINVGEHPDARFTINVFNGTGEHGVFINDVVGVDGHEALAIHQDGKDFTGINPFHISLESSTGADSVLASVITIDADGTGINNSRLDMFVANLLGTPGNNTFFDFLSVDPNVDKIIKVGSADELSAVYYNDVNITANMTDGGVAEVFIVDDDLVYIGNTGNFTTISFSLDTTSSHNQLFNFFYCNNSGDYETLGAVSDSTNGFQDSGTISFTNPSNRGRCDQELDGTPFSDTNNYTYIALQRTRNFVLTNPVIDTIGISGSTQSFLLQKDMIKLQPVTAPPETCDATVEGGIYYDDDINIHCACTGANWVQMNDYSTVCS